MVMSVVMTSLRGLHVALRTVTEELPNIFHPAARMRINNINTLFMMTKYHYAQRYTAATT